MCVTPWCCNDRQYLQGRNRNCWGRGRAGACDEIGRDGNGDVVSLWSVSFSSLFLSSIFEFLARFKKEGGGGTHTGPPTLRIQEDWVGAIGCSFLQESEEFLKYSFSGGLKWRNVVPFAKERLQKAGQTKKERPKTGSFCGGTRIC